MNQFLRKQPFCILFVEDNLGELTDMVRNLKRPWCFPQAKIITARDRSEAMAAIDASGRENKPFDCAILDLQIPDGSGEAAYPSLDVAERFIQRHSLNDRNPAEIWVLHSTAWPEDLKSTKLRAFLGMRGVVHTVVSKKTTGSLQQIIDFLERALVEKALGRLLDDSFFAREMGGESWAVTVRNARRPRPPMNLLAMAGLLVDSWGHLSDYRRGQALRAFAGTELEIVVQDEVAGLRYEKARVAAEAWLEEANRAGAVHP